MTSPEALDATIAHQLLLAKEFYERACADLQARAPFSAGLAASGLQDAVEMCLLALAHHFNVDSDKRFFKELWGDVESKASSNGQHLARVGQMKALNEARVQFKHRGVLPDHDQVERFRADAYAFLEETAQTFFSVDIANLSELELLATGPIKDALRAATTALQSNDVALSLERCADALHGIRSQLEPLYQTGIWVQFNNVPQDINSEIQRQAMNLREQIARVRELALAGLLGLNSWELGAAEALLPERNGDTYIWPNREMPVLPKNVARCVRVLTRYAISVQNHVAHGTHPDWQAI